MYTDVVAGQSRALPPVIFDKESTGAASTRTCSAEGVGLLNIRSVYDVDGATSRRISPPWPIPPRRGADQRPARFLRLEKAVAIPDDDVRDFDTALRRSAGAGHAGDPRLRPGASPTARSWSRCRPMCRWPSACWTAPGGASRSRHQNWLQVRPGEVRSCNGCHDPNSGRVPRAQTAFVSVWAGATARRSAVSEHQAGVLRGHRRDHGRGQGAHQLCHGLRAHHAERGRALRRHLDRSGRRRPRQGCELRLPLRGPDHPGAHRAPAWPAGRPGAGSRSTTRRTFTRSGPSPG